MSKKLITIILIATSGIFYYYLTSTTSYNLQSFKVIRVIDGDTLELENGMNVRLKGINTPEKSMPNYEEAMQFLSAIVYKKTIQIENHGTDKYNRLLAYVFYNNQNINQLIVKNGFAHSYYYDKDNHYDEIIEAEQFAKQNHLGIWNPSPNQNCLQINKFQPIDKTENESEILILENTCDIQLNIIIKDEATHIYKETIYPNSKFTKTFKNIFNDDGDSIFVWDEQGLLMFYHY